MAYQLGESHIATTLLVVALAGVSVHIPFLTGSQSLVVCARRQ